MRKNKKKIPGENLKKGDPVMCIHENVCFTAGRPMNRPDLPVETFFELNKIYYVKDRGLYGQDDSLCYHILVYGSTQFTSYEHFVKVDRKTKKITAEDEIKEIKINGKTYLLIPKTDETS